MDENYSKIFDCAYKLHVSGKLNEASVLYLKLLAVKPDDINVLNLYAQLNVSLKNYDKALEIFKDLYNRTKLDDILINIAKVYFMKNEFESAVSSLKLLARQDISSQRLLASAYMKLLKRNEAIDVYENIIKNYQPAFSDFYNLSILYNAQKDTKNALVYALKAYELNKSDKDINLQLAKLYELSSDWENALNHMLYLASLTNDNNVFYRVGILYKKLNNDAQAIEYFRKILETDSENKEAMLNIALIYKNHDKNISAQILEKLCAKYVDDDSLICCLYFIYENMMNYKQCEKLAKKLIKLKPDYALYYSLAGDSLINLFKYDEALNMYQKAVELDNTDEYTNSQIAFIYSITGKVTDALNILEKYLDTNDEVRKDYAYIQCREKNLQKVREYFYFCHSKPIEEDKTDDKAKRFFYKLNIDKKFALNEDAFTLFKKQKSKNYEDRITQYRKKDWKFEDIKGKRLLVYSSHGAGDCIMCSRYVKELQTLTSKLIIQAPKSLVDLYKYNFPDIDVMANDEIINEELYDYATPYMCILCNLDIDFHKLSGNSYLSVDSSKIAEKAQLDILKNDKKKIGIYWQGNPTILLNRSIKLEKFLPLFELENTQIYSFQISKIDTESENLKQKLPIIDLSNYINSYYDTAAFLMNIDTLVTIDTSIAHLAGALGVKTYLLLPYASEWRWFYDTEKTTWYNSIKIFKQKNSLDWNEVFLRVKNELTV